MEQTTLAIELDPRRELPITLEAELRQRLVHLMGKAIVAVHRASEVHVSEEAVDDDGDK